MITTLILDDLKEMTEVLSQYFNDDGNFTVFTSNSPEEVIELLKTNPVEVIISDYAMPEMNGIDLLEILRGSGNKTPFILMTGMNDWDLISKSFKAGADFFQPKGIDPQILSSELIQKAKAAVYKRRAEIALLKSRELFQNFVAYLPTTVFVADESGEITYLNLHGQDELRYTETKVTFPHSIFDLIVDEKEEIKRILEELNKGVTVSPSEFRIIRRDRTTFWGLFHLQLLNGDGKRLLGSISNIDAQKKTEEIHRIQKEFAEALTLAHAKADASSSLLSTIIALTHGTKGFILSGEERELITEENTPKPLLTALKEASRNIPLSTDYQQSFISYSDQANNENVKDAEWLVIRIPESNIVLPLILIIGSSGSSPMLLREDVLKTTLSLYLNTIERLESEAEIYYSNQNFKTFFNTIENLVFVLNEEGIIEDLNDTASHRLGYEKDELIGVSAINLHPEELREKAEIILKEMLEGREVSCSVPLVTRSGNHIPVESRVSHGIWNKKSALFCVSKDISEITRSEEKFSTAFNTSPVVMAISSLQDNQYIDVNEAFLKTFDLTRKEIIGKPISDTGLFSGMSGEEELFQLLEKKGKIRNFQMKVLSRDGQIKQGLLSGDRIRLGDEECILSIFVDITDEILLKKALESREKILKAVNTIAAQILQSEEWTDEIADILWRIGTVTGMDRVFLSKAKYEGNEIKKLTTWERWPSELVEDQIDSVPPLLRSSLRDKIIGKLSLGESVVFWKDTKDPIISELATPYEYSTIIIIPVFSHVTLWGTLILVSVSPQTFSAIELDALKSAASIIGAAIYRQSIEEMFHQPVEESLAGVFIMQDNRFIYTNPQMSNLLGYSREEFARMEDGHRLLEPDERERLDDAYLAIERSDTGSVQLELRVRTEDMHSILLYCMITRILVNGRPALVGNVMDITARRAAEEALRISEEKYRELFNNVNDAIYVIEIEEGPILRIVEMNEIACTMTGYSRNELLGLPIDKLDINFEHEDYVKIVDFLTREGHITLEGLHRRKDAVNIPVEINAHLFTLTGRTTILAVARNISDRKIADARMRAGEEKIRLHMEQSLKEKETLLKEVHHRVKNNMQLITSMLRLQEYRTEEPGAIATLKESRMRIISMAMLHEKLYRTENFSSIPLEVYLSQLAGQVVREFEQPDQQINLTITCPEHVYVDIDTGIPVGLIINELITNTMKYAFSPGQMAMIRISVIPGSSGWDIIEVSDNGKGLPDDYRPEDSESLGMTLIQNLVMQQKGVVEFISDRGTTVKIRLPVGKLIDKEKEEGR